MAVDLHTHSRVSDGSDSPAELIAKADAAGLTAVALTDHDTLDGIGEAQAAAETASVRLIPGIELSLDAYEGGMHLVVLFLDTNGPLQDRLATIQSARELRNERIVEQLQRLGFAISMDEVVHESGGGIVGRPHVAAILVQKGYFPDPSAVFDELLGTGKPGYVPRERLSPAEAISLARASGGVPILAHPHTLGFDNGQEFAGIVRPLAAQGLIGIESYYGDYPPEYCSDLAETTRSFGLIPSGGSDYHGTYKEGLMLGTGRGTLHVSDDVLEELEAAR